MHDASPPGGLGATLFAALQHLLPQHTLTRLMHRLARSRRPWLKRLLIRGFLAGYRIDMGEAEQSDPLAYDSFNAFFTRALKAGVRPGPAAPEAIASPVDGTVSQCGAIADDQLLQAKGWHYALEALLAGQRAWSERLRGGTFATIYLAPYNYHRIHMPLAGTLRAAWYVPGRLFSVNQATASRVPNLFARNERVILAFEGEHGPFVLVLVGALFVGSMSTVWHGEIAPGRGAPRALPLPAAGATLARGEEVGRFNMGSTVILLLAPQTRAALHDLRPGATLQVGQSLGRLGPSA